MNLFIKVLTIFCGIFFATNGFASTVYKFKMQGASCTDPRASRPLFQFVNNVDDRITFRVNEQQGVETTFVKNYILENKATSIPFKVTQFKHPQYNYFSFTPMNNATSLCEVFIDCICDNVKSKHSSGSCVSSIGLQGRNFCDITWSMNPRDPFIISIGHVSG